VEKVTKADPDLVHGSLVLNVPQAFGENRPKLKKEEKREFRGRVFPIFFLKNHKAVCIYPSLRLTIATTVFYGCWDALSYTQENGVVFTYSSRLRGENNRRFLNGQTSDL
jgi:hypothetical protein